MSSSGNDDSDSNEEEVTISEYALNLMELAKYTIDCLERRIRSAGDNEALVASALLEERSSYGEDLASLGGCVTTLRNRAYHQAAETWQELLHFLDNHDTWPAERFWDHFNNKLVELGETSVEFRKACFHNTTAIEGDDYSIFHLVCKLDPPLKILQTLIDVIPQGDKGFCSSQYNHLSRPSGNWEFPLCTVVRHGCSFELVKFLVEADEKKETLKPFSSDRGEDTLLHVLVSNRENHKPEVFSAILHYLVLHLDDRNLQLIHEGSEEKTPVAIFFTSLLDEGRTHEEILLNDDLVFLLRATCYHQNCEFGNKQKMSKDFDGRHSDIDLISVPYAFFVCSPCFIEETTTTMMEHLRSTDKSFLVDKDMHGIYPIHGVLEDRHSYCVRTRWCYEGFDDYIVTTILRLAPECAGQRNKKGLYPLHIVADCERQSFLSDERRLHLVQTVFKANPDVAGIMDNEINLPSFTLPERYEKSSIYSLEERRSGLSSTYFLLRQRPEMIAETISMIQKESKEVAEPSSKRIKQG
eukprot:scaffold1171_cov103-Skeletonema_dohrnii-CCMP3373.AAC.5